LQGGEEVPPDEAGCPSAIDLEYCWKLGERPKEIQERQIAHFTKADPAYGRRVAEGLGLKVNDLQPKEAALASR